jgi:hypothetical protein
LISSSDEGEENQYNKVTLKMGSKKQELLIPELHFIPFDFLAFKKAEGTNVLHEILKLYANGFCEKVGFYSFQESEKEHQQEKFQKGIVRVN